MKTTTAIIATAAALITPVWGGNILEENNLLLPAENAPAFKKKAAEQYGTLWMVDAAYGFWHTHRAMPETCSRSNNLLLRVLANQRILRNDTHGGTWLLAEFDGAWGLDRRSAQETRYFANGFGSVASPHADARGPHTGVIPELGIMQYLAHRRVCITAGMLNFTNYLDAVSIANCTYCNFTNSGFVNSTVLPLTEANLAAMVQWQFSEQDAATLAFSRCGCEAGNNPFHSRDIDGYALAGEYRHDFADGAYTLRLNPFLKHTHADTNGGLCASVEANPCDWAALFLRTGAAVRQTEDCNCFDLSLGARLYLIPERRNDFLGVAWGVFKGAPETHHAREQALEITYSLQLTDWLKLKPHFQYIHNPAYRNDTRDEALWGVQAVFSF